MKGEERARRLATKRPKGRKGKKTGEAKVAGWVIYGRAAGRKASPAQSLG